MDVLAVLQDRRYDLLHFQGTLVERFLSEDEEFPFQRHSGCNRITTYYVFS